MHTCGLPHHAECDCPGLENVENYKYLGVVFDSRLKWVDHIQYVKNKIRKLMYFFKLISEFLTVHEIRRVYCAHVQTLLEGGIVAYGGAYRSSLQPLLTTQKTILKIATNKNRRYSSDQLFRDLNVLDVRQIYIKNLLLYIFSNYTDIFVQPVNVYPTRTNVDLGIFVPRMNLTFSTTNAFFNVHTLYRNIPNYLRDMRSCTLSTYKQRVIRWLHEIGRNASDALLNPVYR